MKYRESGMPSEEMWNTFFSPSEILNKMGIDNQVRTVIDIGCGYGTFLLSMAKLVSKNVIGVDIEDQMISICRNKIKEHCIENVKVMQGDISTDETIEALKKYEGEIDYITLFNILHCEEPTRLLKSAYDILNNNGRIGVIHWKYDETTPRGPSMEIRPKPEMIVNWATQRGFVLEKQIELPPYHYGMIFIKN